VNVIALGLNLTSVKDKTNAQNSLEALDKALQQVTGTRAEFGAIQNRLQSVISNIQVSKENLSSANSRIRDADLAEETSELTKNQILLQSGTAVLGQANSTVKSVLSLLGNQG
jgi:flagellin